MIDRPLGSHHPKHNEMVYPINYGYYEDLIAPDGEPQDVYVLGVYEPISCFEGKLIAVIHRLDDIEDKWVVAPEEFCFTEKEIIEATHFQEQFFNVSIIM
ncbi:MAG: inorganic diphosphatase [Eubacterium sp.]|nr:inorganic diphosphatase [Eubacterium sp.]